MKNSSTENNSVIAVVIVNYRTPELLIACLASLEKERVVFPKLYAIVVDNASPDNSVSLITNAIEKFSWQGWVRLVPAEKNGGYAYGNNMGFASAKAWLSDIDYFWMLNPDTRALPGSTQGLVNFLQAQPSTIAGCCLQDEDGTKQVSTFNFPGVISEFCSGLGLGVVDRLCKRFKVVRDIPSSIESSDWMAGASLMFTSKTQAKLGNLDERYFLYFEEVDYLLKAQRMGIHCWYIPESKVIHEVGAATGISDVRKRQPRRPAYWFESRRYYFLKNYSILRLALADLVWILAYSSWCARKYLTDRQQVHQQPPKLLRDFIRHSLFNPFSWF